MQTAIKYDDPPDAQVTLKYRPGYQMSPANLNERDHLDILESNLTSKNFTLLHLFLSKYSRSS